MPISISAIMSKVEAFSKTPEGKRRMNDTISSIRTGGGKGKRTAAGSEVLTITDMSVKADELVLSVKRAAQGFAAESGAIYGIPPHVMAEIDTLSHTAPTELPGGDYCVDLYFAGNLHRDSLDDSYSGVDNIIALFNNGYHASNYVYGFWDGHSYTGEYNALRSGFGNNFAYVRSRKDRPQLHFMQAAVNDFNRNYTARYGAKAVLSDEYE